MKKVAFIGHKGLNRGSGFGDVFSNAAACWIAGKQSGYQEISVTYPTITTTDGSLEGINFSNQNTGYLPWKYIDQDKEDLSLYDKVININEKNVLYDGFPGNNINGYYMIICSSVYHNRTGIQPYIDIKRDTSKKYILFHWRQFDTELDKMKMIRNSDPIAFRTIYKYLKKIYGDEYEFWKMGEFSGIDHKFDRIIEPEYDMNNCVKTIANSSLCVVPQSSSSEIAYYIKDLPIIRYGSIDEYDVYVKSTLDRFLNGKSYGIDKHPNWDVNLLVLHRGERINFDSINHFVNRIEG